MSSEDICKHCGESIYLHSSSKCELMARASTAELEKAAREYAVLSHEPTLKGAFLAGAAWGVDAAAKATEDFDLGYYDGWELREKIAAAIRAITSQKA